MANDVKLGVLLDETAQRDAIHVAIAPVIAAHLISPGERVGLLDLSDEGMGIRAGRGVDPIGIVDPFLSATVNPGERFYLFLFPNTVTSLRHHWTHPAFAAIDPHGAESRELSEAWLRRYATSINDYEDAERAFQTLVSNLRGGVVVTYGSSAYNIEDIPTPDLLIAHAENFLGIQIDRGGLRVSCSC